MERTNRQPDASAEGYEVDAQVVARRLQVRLAERTAEHEWELAIRDARIADLEATVRGLRESLDELTAPADARGNVATPSIDELADIVSRTEEDAHA